MWSRYDIPRSTRDLSTASTLELRRIVARPFRFQRAIIKKNLSRRSPIKLQNHTTELRWIETNCVEAILISGGRWLVILSEGRVNSSYDDEQPMSAVTVYDIRMPAEKCFTVVAHSRLHGEQACYSGITVSPDPVGPGPMVFAEISHRGSAGK
ncbi:hypothetical protein FRB94_007510 [Tulasnella sp. JGI-2019a]|nr:hypothetical protein FRB93_007136 [Tulasnella sp. JGI-2019a]KAG8997679.1 hypothetical protein FRB94_007510 [Tulasnella sp. JGI-2019a]